MPSKKKSTDWLIEWLVDWLIDWFTDRSIDWLIDWLIDCIQSENYGFSSWNLTILWNYFKIFEENDSRSNFGCVTSANIGFSKNLSCPCKVRHKPCSRARRPSARLAGSSVSSREQGRTRAGPRSIRASPKTSRRVDFCPDTLAPTER